MNPGAASSNPREFAFANGKLYFQATVDGKGSELAVSDGTSAGTQQISDLAPGAASSSPRHIAQVDNHLVFIADHPDYGTELFTLDITTGTLSPLQSNIELSIAPNPVSDETMLTLPAACDWQHGRVRLFNIAGKLTWESTPTGTDCVLHLQSLSSGIYWLEYADASGHFGRAKLIKE